MARGQDDKRVTATIDTKTYAKLSYLAENDGISLSEALREAIVLLIRYKNEDYYPVARIEAQRINQLVDAMIALSSNIKSLEKICVEGFSSILGLTRGDNYLFDNEEDA